MTWRIRRRGFKWWIGRNNNSSDVPYTLTQHEADAAEFPTRDAAFTAMTELTTFQSGYELVEGVDDGHSDATGTP